MREVSGALSAHIAARTRKVTPMLRLDLNDGTIIGVTGHSEALLFNLGDGEISYSASTGIEVSDVALVVGLESSNFEVAGPIGALVTRSAVLGGRFTRARARLFMVNWDDLTMGKLAVMEGQIAVARVEGRRFVFEVRNAADAFNQTIGDILTPYCKATFGDTLCGVVRTAFPCTVTAVTDAFRYTVNLGGSHADDFFNLGEATFLTGDLTGLTAEVFDYVGATGAVEMFAPFPEAPQVGDTLNLFRGCSKLLLSEDEDLPTCLTYDNVERFRGYPEVPGSDSYLKIAVPGAGGA